MHETDLSTIAGENKYSYVGSPIGSLDLWDSITDLQINPNGTEFIFSDQTSKIREINFVSSLFILTFPLFSPFFFFSPLIILFFFHLSQFPILFIFFQINE